MDLNGSVVSLATGTDVFIKIIRTIKQSDIKVKNIIIVIFISLWIGSCNSKRLENTKELSLEIKSSQIKRVTNTQLIYSADEWGKKIAQIAEKTLANELAKHPDKAKELCGNPGQIAVISALQKEYGVHIELLGADARQNKNLAPKEIELFEAYLYSAKNNSPASDNVQQLSDTLLVYNVPVATDKPVCRICMEDQELPFALWRLLFNKKEIIRKLDAKQLIKEKQ